MAKSRPPISRFVLEIFSIFLGVTIAFLANHWNEQRKERILEEKILKEINVELASDLTDLNQNIYGHEQGIVAVKLFRRYMQGEAVDYDSLSAYFERLYRDYISITNTTGYEMLRSRGLEVIRNDQLRSEIVNLYDFKYEIITKLEEEYHPAQFHKNYFTTLSHFFRDYMEVGETKLSITRPYNGEPDPEIMLILREIQSWRTFLIDAYRQSINSIAELRADITAEVGE